MQLILALLLSQNFSPALEQANPGIDSLIQTQNEMNFNTNSFDGHNHTSGNGAQVPIPAGAYVAASTPFNGFPITSLYYETFTDGGAGPSHPLTAWFDGQDFCVELGDASKVCLTCNGGVCVGDGGIPSVACVNGVCLQNGCLTFPNGASICGDTGPGDVLVQAVDGGSIYNQIDGTTREQIDSAGILVTGNMTASGYEIGNLGNYTQAGQQTSYDLYGLSCTTEIGLNTVETLVDGGFKEIACGMGAANCFEVVFDGGNPTFQTDHLGVTKIGDPISGAAAVVTPNLTGGAVKIGAQSSNPTFTSIGLALNPKGPDGGIITNGHIDTGDPNNGVTTVSWPAVSDGGTNAPSCLGDAGAAAVPIAVATDSAGVVILASGYGAGTCAPGTPLFAVTFAEQYYSEAYYALGVWENASSISPGEFGGSGCINATKSATGFIVKDNGTCNDNAFVGALLYGFDYHALGVTAQAH